MAPILLPYALGTPLVVPSRVEAALHQVTGAVRSAAGWLWREPRRFPVTVTLLGALIAARVLRGVAPDVAHRWQWATSTTLHQMVHHPLGVLVGSIPWVTEGPVLPWLALGGLAVGGLEAAIGSGAAFAVLFAGHTGATLISEGALGLRVASGALPSSALHILDVGPSYVIATSLVALVALPGRRRLRLGAGIVLVAIAPAMMYGLADGDVDGMGHTAAFVLGALAGAVPLLRRRALRRPSLTPAPAPAPLTADGWKDGQDVALGGKGGAVVGFARPPPTARRAASRSTVRAWGWGRPNRSRETTWLSSPGRSQSSTRATSSLRVAPAGSRAQAACHSAAP